MPIPTRSLLRPAFLIAFLSLSACSGRAPEPVAAPPEPPKEVVSSLRDETLRQARMELERGETLARTGQWREARLAFDRAVDLLLTIPGGVEASDEARALYGDVIATAHEMERDYGLIGGNIFHGELTLDQLFFLRPAAGWADYRTPIRGFWQCGSGTHPGGGITSGPGRLAALEILRSKQ